jgi:hypothetical protein
MMSKCVDFSKILVYNRRVKVEKEQAMTELYRCDIEDDHHVIRKFDEDYSLLSKYNVTTTTCDCPRGQHRTCRHRHTILPLFLAHEHVGDGWFLDFHTHQWRGPIEDYSDNHEPAPAADWKTEGCDSVMPAPEAQVTPARAPSTGFRRRV